MKKSGVVICLLFIFLISCSNSSKNIEGTYLVEGYSSVGEIEKHGDELYLISYLSKDFYERMIETGEEISLSYNDIKSIPIHIYRLSGIGDNYKLVAKTPSSTAYTKQRIDEDKKEKSQLEEFKEEYKEYIDLMENGLKVEDFTGERTSDIKIIRNTDGIIEGFEVRAPKHASNQFKGELIVYKRQ